jgi:hypothetical protein
LAEVNLLERSGTLTGAYNKQLLTVNDYRGRHHRCNILDSVTKDLTPVYKKYKGKWVAMDDGFAKVVVSGKTSLFVYQKAKKWVIRSPTFSRFLQI